MKLELAGNAVKFYNWHFLESSLSSKTIELGNKLTVILAYTVLSSYESTCDNGGTNSKQYAIFHLKNIIIYYMSFYCRIKTSTCQMRIKRTNCCFSYLIN